LLSPAAEATLTTSFWVMASRRQMSLASRSLFPATSWWRVQLHVVRHFAVGENQFFLHHV